MKLKRLAKGWQTNAIATSWFLKDKTQNGVAVLQQFEEIPINVLSRDCDRNLIVKISAPTHRGWGADGGGDRGRTLGD